MDRERQIRALGLGLYRGLVDGDAAREALQASEPLAVLANRGLLAQPEATALCQALTEDTLPPTGAPPPPPASDLAGGVLAQDPWDSLPSSGRPSASTGRLVLRVLTLPAWKHYRNLRFLAEGGMGRVFKAWDPTLKRSVALKFLRRDDPDLVARFTLEAQHQARMEHPHICRVYEVGEWQDQSYIAMQFVEGETLDAARLDLDLNEIAQVMEAVAEAIHAAHRAGLIHRDLKPANILVRRTESGIEPTILDFGLARGAEDQQLTQQGLAVGTLHYMAPEQARSDHTRIDRRTDVYGLGATLHRALTGEPPFAAFEGLEALRRTVEMDVPPLRRLVPDLPEDLDTITRKCLEKDPARRYESALAVAEDLRRWREGEPILARRPTLGYRARRWAWRHRPLVALGSAALLAILALGGMALTTAATARAQARHAQHFGQEAERIEALIRYSHLLPPHDVRPELAQARARMQALEAEAARAGRLAAGPAAYALGRSHLALGEVEPALRQLQQAWDSGLRGPEVALALGRAQAASYRQALEQARALPTRELREARERSLARELRDPALAHLREGAPAALEAPAYHEALVAFMEGQWEGARAQAQAALAATPWFFEAKRLEGEALLAQAQTAPTPGEALDRLAQAEEAFEATLRLGPSDPATGLHLVQSLVERTKTETSSGGRAEPTLARCRAATARVQTLLPDDGRAPAHLARALTLWADTQPLARANSRAAYAEAEQLSAISYRRSPDDPEVLALRIRMLLVIGRMVRTFGEDPLPRFQEAQELARRACQRFPGDPLYPALLSAACMRRMTWEINAGLSPWTTFEEGLAQALSLRARFPTLGFGYLGLVTLWTERAEYERRHGLDPLPSVAQVLQVFQEAKASGLRLNDADYGRGDAHIIQADHLYTLAGGGEADYLEAAKAYRQAREANRNHTQALSSEAAARVGQAQVQLEQGQDPSLALAAAEALLDAQHRHGTNPNEADHVLGLVALLRGRHLLAQGGEPMVSWNRAVKAFQRSQTRSGAAKHFHGEAEVAARAYLHRGRAQDRQQALAAARKALLRDPQGAEGWLWIAVVEQEALRRGEAAAKGAAQEAWARTLAINANLRRVALQLGMPAE